MLSQRARVAESRVKNRLSNGPLRAQSNVGNYRVFCDGRLLLVAKDMMVSYKGTSNREIKVAPRIRNIRPWQKNFCQGRFFIQL